MFVVKKHVQTSKTTEREKTMSTKPNATVNEPGIIGQMYEDRKSKKRGVLESREPKYKTLMLRDADGKSFNITYSTFKSNWRKYDGSEVVQTSAQVEETKTEEKKVAEKAKKEIATPSEKSMKFTTEEKVKAVRATVKFIEDRIKANNSSLEVFRNSRGGIIVGHKRATSFEVWVKYGIDRYDIFFRDVIADTLSKEEFKALAKNADYTEHETWKLRHGYRVANTELGNFIDKLIVICDAYDKAKNAAKEDDKKENTKTKEKK